MWLGSFKNFYWSIFDLQCCVNFCCKAEWLSYTHVLLLLLLSHFSRVWLCATPETAAHQASPSLGFSRQEHWSGLPFPSSMHESEKWKWSCSVLSDSSDPMDCSLPGSSVHGIFQARVLEWGAIAFSLLLRPFNWRQVHFIGPVPPSAGDIQYIQAMVNTRAYWGHNLTFTTAPGPL